MKVWYYVEDCGDGSTRVVQCANRVEAIYNEEAWMEESGLGWGESSVGYLEVNAFDDPVVSDALERLGGILADRRDTIENQAREIAWLSWRVNELKEQLSNCEQALEESHAREIENR